MHKLKIRYTTSDGEIFDDLLGAEAHEENIFYDSLARDYDISIAAARYIYDHNLVSEDLNEVAFWGIQAAQSNEDVLYRLYRGRLGIVHGTLLKAIDYAVTLPAFLQFDYGGVIKKIDIVEV